MIDKRHHLENIKNYQSFLRRNASERIAEFLATGGIEHTAILMSVLLEHTHSIVRIYCHGFKPDLMTIEPLWSSLKEYLNNKKKKLMILVDSSDYTNDEPLEMIYQSIKRRNDDSIQVRLIGEDDKRKMRDFFSDDSCYFSVFDNDKYSYMTNPVEFQTISSFYDLAYCNSLIELFNQAFYHSTSLF